MNKIVIFVHELGQEPLEVKTGPLKVRNYYV